MIGAILGDMIGAPYEFDRSPKTKEFPLFSRGSAFTDDSVLTIAVAEALMNTLGQPDDEIKAVLVASMQKWGKRFPDAGYGDRFCHWLYAAHPEPYGSCGNGAAMRVSPAGWLFSTLEETRHMARLTAEVTHNHPEGVKGAEAIAIVLFLARTGRDKEEIREYVVSEFGYDLSRTCDEIRPDYHHVETCQQTVPEAITAFLEGSGFEDVLRTAVSLGGDCDTLTCIAGSLAEAYYGVPDELAVECRRRLPDEMRSVLNRFSEMKLSAEKPAAHDVLPDGNEQIEEAIRAYRADAGREKWIAVLESIRIRMHAGGRLLIPVVPSEDGRAFTFRTVQAEDGREWLAAFTSPAECRKGEPSQVVPHFIDAALKACLALECTGFLLNPWGESFLLPNERIEQILRADGGVEYAVPDVPITAKLLEGGAFLKRAIGICTRNRTRRNMLKLMKILRDSWVWIPCQAVLSEADRASMEKLVREAQENGDLSSFVGKTLRSQGAVRMIPDILQSGEDFFLPAFTSAEEMGDYGSQFSKLEKPFREAVALARNHEKNLKGIVINAFSEPFVLPGELFDLLETMPSGLDAKGGCEKGAGAAFCQLRRPNACLSCARLESYSLVRPENASLSGPGFPARSTARTR